MADFNHLLPSPAGVETTSGISGMGRAFWLTALAIFLFHGFLLVEYRHLDDLANSNGYPVVKRILDEGTGTIAGLVVFPPLVWFIRRGPGWGHLAGVLTYSLVHSGLMYSWRYLAFPLAGAGRYHPGILWMKFAMELPNDVVYYGILVGFVLTWEHLRQSRQRELFTAQLQRQLAQSQLQNLRLQLQPHFLFNTLHMISSIMYEDLRMADAMMSRLSDLLRHTLQAPQVAEVVLKDELKTLQFYLEIMQARFEDRLQVAYEVSPEMEGALVPPFLLQPLVENAIQHGADPNSALVAIEVRARAEAGQLVLEVEDHGKGMPAGAMVRKGIGLGNTEERLRQLYGQQQDIAWTNISGGGLCVVIRLPLRMAGV